MDMEKTVANTVFSVTRPSFTEWYDLHRNPVKTSKLQPQSHTHSNNALRPPLRPKNPFKVTFFRTQHPDAEHCLSDCVTGALG